MRQELTKASSLWEWSPVSISTGCGKPWRVPRKESRVLPTGPVPDSWLYLQGPPDVFNCMYFLCLLRRKWLEENSKVPDFLIFPTGFRDGSVGQQPWTGKIYSSGLYKDGTVLTLLCPPPNSSPLPKPATALGLSSWMIPPSIFNLSTKAET